MDIQPVKSQSRTPSKEVKTLVANQKTDGSRLPSLTNIDSLMDPRMDDMHPTFIRFLIESTNSGNNTTSSSYLALISLKRVCTRFYEIIYSQMLDLLKKDHQPENFIYTQFRMFDTLNSDPDPTQVPEWLISDMEKMTAFYFFALTKPEEIACKAYITVFNQRLNDFLALTENTQCTFQRMKNDSTSPICILGLPNFDSFPINQYIFLKFLQKYIQRTQFLVEPQLDIIISFLKQYSHRNEILELMHHVINKIVFMSENALLDYPLMNSIIEDDHFIPVFIEKFITTDAFLTFVADESDNAVQVTEKIVDFLDRKCNQNPELIFQLIYRLAAPSFLFSETIDLSNGSIWMILFLKKCFTKEVRLFLLPKIIHSLSNNLNQNAIDLLCHIIDYEGFKESQQTQIVDIFSRILDTPDSESTTLAIPSITSLGERNLLDMNSLEVFKTQIIKKLQNSNNNEIKKLSLSFLIRLFQILSFKEADELIPKVLFLLTTEDTEFEEAAISFLKLHHTSQNFSETQYSTSLVDTYISILASESRNIHVQILTLCNQLVEIKLNQLFKAFDALKAISLQYLCHPDEVLRYQALKLLTLIVPDHQELSNIVCQFFLQSLIQKSAGAMLNANFKTNNLFEFFKNFNHNMENLMQNLMDFINNSIDKIEGKGS